MMLARLTQENEIVAKNKIENIRNCCPRKMSGRVAIVTVVARYLYDCEILECSILCWVGKSKNELSVEYDNCK